MESTQVQEHMDIPKDTSRNQSPQRSDEVIPQRRKGEGTPQSNEPLRRSTRHIKAPIRYRDCALMSQVMTVFEPLNYEESKNHKE